MSAHLDIPRHIVFWQSIPSQHQSSFIRALADTGEVDVTFVAETPLDDARRQLGWFDPDFGRATLVVQPAREEVRALAATGDASTLHVFSGIPSTGMLADAFEHARRTGASGCMQAECPDPRGVAGCLRFVRDCTRARRWRSDFLCVLAIGAMAPRWYVNAGFPASRVFPFAYFTEPSHVAGAPVVAQSSDPSTPSACFLGQLDHRKGVDLLLRGWARLPRTSGTLSVVGTGPDEAALKALGSQLGISREVRFTGSLPNREAIALISRSDLLVLPSRWDGWGAVVNEALTEGTPVICSDRCGAAELLDGGVRGSSFRAGSVTSLSAALRARLEKGKLRARDRATIRAWSRSIEGDAGAWYFREVIHAAATGGPRPTPPWRDC